MVALVFVLLYLYSCKEELFWLPICVFIYLHQYWLMALCKLQPTTVIIYFMLKLFLILPLGVPSNCLLLIVSVIL